MENNNWSNVHLMQWDIWTTACIFGASKVSLQRGRYTFRHITVLREIIEVVKTFILSIKDTVPISAKSSIKFVKKGAKVPCKRTPPVGVWHHTSDWILLADLNKHYFFPVHAAFTQLRPQLKKLGFNNKLIRSTIKKLCESSMECSFVSG